MTEDMANDSGGGGRGLPRKTDIDKRLCVKVKEAAAILGLSRNFTYDLVKQGKLPMIKFRKRLLIPRAALEEMLGKDVKR